MWLKSILVNVLTFLLLSVQAAPASGSTGKKSKWKDVDLSKIYAPNPPATHTVLMTLGYHDASQDKDKEYEIIIELYGTVVPLTVQNFAALSNGVHFKYHNADDPDAVHPFTFKKSIFHKIIPGKLIQGGDVFDNHAALSIHGHHWDDENFDLKHDRPGRLSMANEGPNTQGSEFFIVTQLEPATEFDNKNVVFGQVVSGLDALIDDIQYVDTNAQGKPVEDVSIKYALVEQASTNKEEEKHAAYLKALEEFQRGDLTKGVTIANMVNEGAKEEKVMNDLMFRDLHHPLFKVVLGMAVLLSLYLLARSRRKLFSKSSNIVSLRRE